MSNGTNLQTNVLPLLGMEPTVQTVRIAAIVGMILSLSGLLVIGLYIYSAIQKNQEALIRLKHGSLLVDVYDGAYEPVPPVIDVTSIDNLAKLAERHSTMILHITRDFLQDYLVQGNNATYRFSISTGTNRLPTQTPVQPETFGVALNTCQSQSAGNRQSYRELGYWGTDQYELEDTQPTTTVQRSYHNNTRRHNPVDYESDQTIFIRKIKL